MVNLQRFQKNGLVKMFQWIDKKVKESREETFVPFFFFV